MAPKGVLARSMANRLVILTNFIANLLAVLSLSCSASFLPERDMYHGICAFLTSFTIDVTVAFVLHAKTLQIFCLAWRVRVACQMRAKQGKVKY